MQHLRLLARRGQAQHGGQLEAMMNSEQALMELWSTGGQQTPKVGQPQQAEGELQQPGQQGQLPPAAASASEPGRARGDRAAAVSRLVRATGPVLSWS